MKNDGGGDGSKKLKSLLGRKLIKDAKKNFIKRLKTSLDSDPALPGSGDVEVARFAPVDSREQKNEKLKAACRQLGGFDEIQKFVKKAFSKRFFFF